VPPGPWQATRVRFLASGRAEETPTAIFWDGRWLAVRLLGDERLEGPVAGGPRTRRLRLAGEAGARYELTGPDAPAQGPWRVRRLDGDSPLGRPNPGQARGQTGAKH
jgi:hypothetical protein